MINYPRIMLLETIVYRAKNRQWYRYCGEKDFKCDTAFEINVGRGSSKLAIIVYSDPAEDMVGLLIRKFGGQQGKILNLTTKDDSNGLIRSLYHFAHRSFCRKFIDNPNISETQKALKRAEKNRMKEENNILGKILKIWKGTDKHIL